MNAALNFATADLFHAEIARLQAEVGRLRGDLEVMRLQRDAARGSLTDAEREAVQAAAWEADGWLMPERAATLRGLLERTRATGSV